MNRCPGIRHRHQVRKEYNPAGEEGLVLGYSGMAAGHVLPEGSHSPVAAEYIAHTSLAERLAVVYSRASQIRRLGE